MYIPLPYGAVYKMHLDMNVTEPRRRLGSSSFFEQKGEMSACYAKPKPMRAGKVLEGRARI